MTYDIAALRSHFPALAAGTAHFDGPGGTQTPAPVVRAIADALEQPLSNRGRITLGERNAERIVTGARRAMADLLGADPAGIVFGRSATQLTYEFSRTLAKTWAPGDEVVVTRLDHDANIRPWIQSGATVRWAEFDPRTGELTVDAIRSVLSARTRLVAVTAASNLIGTRPDIPAIAAAAHEVGALVYVDGVHHAAHSLVDMEDLGADFFVCSPYKFLGPHHGVLAARPELLETLRPDKLLPSTDAVPERFELGTLPYEFLAGTTAAVDFLADRLDTDATGGRRQRLAAGFAALEAHEHVLRARIDEGLAALDGVTVHSRAADRTPTVLLTFDHHSTADAYGFLAERGVQAPAGSFYAIEASRHLGLGDTGGLRVGLAPYNNLDDVDRLLTGLTDFLKR
ncbi:cysteine desulfurase family protein (TIGR01976 family) [Streptomyces sp. SAI-208]|uniref:cysteine desulfurase-like protein n=1 Tax=unclassified Streptomyces TaxID=2593676 RepID=UPI002473884F|nr:MULTISPECIES: cysteine desulfurase-like protein [unclassified Streptomyces]MDH6582907.1 cysteine desulfurase family protein (TIGR01976 family) [Streptomyces sp. SAI-133]MDH6611825.1 cysteine desulfurase family protein (TIGR01976 family) [Streptomyces sp. SAI-208]